MEICFKETQVGSLHSDWQHFTLHIESKYHRRKSSAQKRNFWAVLHSIELSVLPRRSFTSSFWKLKFSSFLKHSSFPFSGTQLNMLQCLPEWNLGGHRARKIEAQSENVHPVCGFQKRNEIKTLIFHFREFWNFPEEGLQHYGFAISRALFWATRIFMSKSWDTMSWQCELRSCLVLWFILWRKK